MCTSETRRFERPRNCPAHRPHVDGQLHHGAKRLLHRGLSRPGPPPRPAAHFERGGGAGGVDERLATAQRPGPTPAARLPPPHTQPAPAWSRAGQDKCHQGALQMIPTKHHAHHIRVRRATDREDGLPPEQKEPRPPRIRGTTEPCRVLPPPPPELQRRGLPQHVRVSIIAAGQPPWRE